MIFLAAVAEANVAYATSQGATGRGEVWLGRSGWRRRNCRGARWTSTKEDFGLIERLFALSVIIWLYVISTELIPSPTSERQSCPAPS
jgi:hypothetical protein